MFNKMIQRLRWPLLGTLILLGGLFAQMMPASAEVPSSQVPSSLKAAIEATIEARGHTYAGFCRDIDQNQHHFEWCAFVQSLTDTRAEVTFGPVATNDIHTAVFNKSGDSWVLAGGNPGPDASVPIELKAAIKAAVEARGEKYAGLCNEIVQHEHVMEWCAGIQSLTATHAEVFIGAVLSDELHPVSFVKSGDKWVVEGSAPSPTPTPDTSVPVELKAAIKAAVEARGEKYAGLCNEIVQHEHVMEWCAGIQSLTATHAKVFIGAVLSDELHPVNFVKSGDKWVVEGSAPSPTPTPDKSVPAELRAAIKAAVEARGQKYAGLCGEIVQHEHVMEWCASIQSLTPTHAKVVVGAVLSDELHQIKFVKSGQKWIVSGAIAPPNTGDAGLASR